MVPSFGGDWWSNLSVKIDNFDSLCEKWFVATKLFLGTAGNRTTPKVVCSGSSTAAIPSNGTVGAAGNTSRPYKYVDLYGRLVCRGGYYQPPLLCPFVGAAESPAAPTNARCIYSSHLLPPRATLSTSSKKGWEALGSSQKLFC